MASCQPFRSGQILQNIWYDTILGWVLTVWRPIKAGQRLNEIIMKSALWLWQIYHIRAWSCRPESGSGQELRAGWQANLVNMVKFQLGGHSSWSGQHVRTLCGNLVGSSWRWGVKFFTANCVKTWGANCALRFAYGE